MNVILNKIQKNKFLKEEENQNLQNVRRKFTNFFLVHVEPLTSSVKPIKPLIQGAIDGVAMTPDQYSYLQAQLQIHFQLLCQVYALCFADKKNVETEQLVLKLIMELDEFRKNAIYWKNLLAISLPQPKENRRITRSQTKSPLKREEIFSIFHGVHGFDVLQNWLKTVKQTPPEQYQEDSLIKKIFSPFGDSFNNNYLPTSEKLKAGRLNFTEAEDRLLALGLQKYGTQDWKSIVQFLLPTKTEKQLTNRYKNMSSTRGADNNPIKLYNHTKKQPFTEEEKVLLNEGIKKYGNNWEAIHTNLLPHRKPNSIKKYWQENPNNKQQQKIQEGKISIPIDVQQNTTFKVPKESKKRKSNESTKPPQNQAPIKIVPNNQNLPPLFTQIPQFSNPFPISLPNPLPQQIPQIQPQIQPQYQIQPISQSQLFIDTNSRISLFSNFEFSKSEVSLGSLIDSSKTEISFGPEISLLGTTVEKSIEWEFENIDSDDDEDRDIFEFENIDSDTEIEMNWTKDEDRLILNWYIQNGYKNIPSIFKKLIEDKLIQKSCTEIQMRISQLIKKWNEK